MIFLATVTSLSTKVTNAASALGNLCQTVDFVSHKLNQQHSSINAYDCCSNSANLKTVCLVRSIASASGAITTNSGGTCQSTDSACAS